MKPLVLITRFHSGPAPYFDAEWRGRSVVIHLDTSAAMKILGDGSFLERDDLLAGAAAQIANAAEPLIAASLVGNGRLAVTLSALDFE